jgi:uncharacterized protein
MGAVVECVSSPKRDLLPEPEAIETSQRFDSLDILRGIALFGVLAVNLVTEFRVSIFAQFLTEPAERKIIDRAVTAFISYGLELKAFALFSFLFGVGMAMQFDRLSSTGRPFYWVVRRLLILLAFGFIHLLLIWNGDILTEYALAGLIVLPLLRASPQVMTLAATALFALYLALPVLPLPIRWPDAVWIANHVQQANQIYRFGNWIQTTRFSLQELQFLLPLHIYIFPRTLGLFVLGMLAWRKEIFSRVAGHQKTILRSGGLFTAGGIAITLMNESGVSTTMGLPGVLANLTPVFAALAFTAMILYAVEFTSARAFLRFFAPIGRMAFTNYIFQSLVFGFLFFGYGLGQFGVLRPAPVFVLGIAVYSGQVQLSRLWSHRYRFGPIEWLWRTLMYGRRQAMKR